MNIPQSSQSIIKKPLAWVIDYYRAHYELLFPTVPKSAADITREQTPKIVSRLLRADWESWKYITRQQRAEKRIAVLWNKPNTLSLVVAKIRQRFQKTKVPKTIEQQTQAFWNTDLEKPKSINPNYYLDWIKTNDKFIP